MKAAIWNNKDWIAETDPERLRVKFERLLIEAGFTLLTFSDHYFEPFGYSALWLLAESHFAVHTFPEENTTYWELSSCNEKMQIAFMELME